MGLLDNLFKRNNNIDTYLKKGFDFNYLSDNYIYLRNNKYYTHNNVNNCLRILKDCANLINTTKKPDVFFERYLLAISILNELITIQSKFKFSGKRPSEIKRELYEKEIFTVNDFLDRYYNETLVKLNSLKTEKAKLSRIDNFCTGLNNYKCYLSEDSLLKYNELCIRLKDNK